MVAMLRRSLAGLLVLFSGILTVQASAQCHAPDAGASAKIVGYLQKRFQVPETGSLVLVESAQENAACFWKLHYKMLPSQRDIVMYLSPDRSFLTPTLYDLSTDPLQEMKAKAAALQSELTTGDPAAKGNKTAAVSIVEFSDFQCPFCKRMTDVLEQEILPKEGDKVRVVFRNFPLPIHPWAKDAAEISECANLQKPEAFWAMHDYFFKNQAQLNASNVRTQALAFAATQATIDTKQLQFCVDHELALGPLTHDLDLGKKLTVHGTPTLFVNGTRYDGFHSAAELEAIIAAAADGKTYQAPVRATERPSPTAAADAANRCIVPTATRRNDNEIVLAQ